jgi:hypothetical protein
MKKLALLTAAFAAMVTGCSTDRGGSYYIDDASAYRADTGTFSNSEDTLGEVTGPGMHGPTLTSITGPGTTGQRSSWSTGERGIVP